MSSPSLYSLMFILYHGSMEENVAISSIKNNKKLDLKNMTT